MNTHQRTSPTRNARAVSGTASVSSQTATSRARESGAIRRAVRTAAKAARRKHATTSTGARARRVSRLELYRRCAIRTATAANAAMVRISRSGRTKDSMTAGSDAVSMNAFPGSR